MLRRQLPICVAFAALVVACGGAEKVPAGRDVADASNGDHRERDAASNDAATDRSADTADSDANAIDAAYEREVDASSDGDAGLCSAPVAPRSNADAGQCLGIYYAHTRDCRSTRQ